ncbi:MAG: class II aldolase/adducin family protein [Ignavibacteriae bacterium]|nr:class II aldolase/adducin family protein [Ignavibacteria bacterium]MBI3365487.1 class II aldolase/adducin family protein [Ignavibacteriota bacterium]
MGLPQQQLASNLLDICHRLYARGFVTATDGNVSVRLRNGNFLTTRTSVNKGMIAPDDLVEVNPEGIPITSHLQPSTEIGMHLFIYSQRPDVNAIVHAHPTYATGFATARQSLTDCIFPEVIVGLGAIPLAEYATPSTNEVAESLLPYVKSADAILLTNHGVVTYGKGLFDAYFKMEKVEHAAHITFVARMLGGAKPLSSSEVEKLRAISQRAYAKDFSDKIACEPESGNSNEVPTDEEIREIVRQMIQA